jgi:hypothetical protein
MGAEGEREKEGKEKKREKERRKEEEEGRRRGSPVKLMAAPNGKKKKITGEREKEGL